MNFGFRPSDFHLLPSLRRLAVRLWDPGLLEGVTDLSPRTAFAEPQRAQRGEAATQHPDHGF
jgi:hypothetical protein